MFYRRIPEAIIIAEHESPRKETTADGMDTLNYLVPSCPRYRRPQSAIIGGNVAQVIRNPEIKYSVDFHANK